MTLSKTHQQRVFALSASALEALGEGAEAVADMLADESVQAQIRDFLGDDPYEVVVHQVSGQQKGEA